MYGTKPRVLGPAQKYIPGYQKLNILIVDDDENSRESLKDIITSRGHNVVALDEGMKCVNRCSECTFDLIFMDYHINEIHINETHTNETQDEDEETNGSLHGTDVTKMVRECFDIKTAVYAYTGDNSVNAVNDFKKNNMKGAFIKPVTPGLMNEFFTIVEKNMDDMTQLSKLSLKRKNFMYFEKKKKNICIL